MTELTRRSSGIARRGGERAPGQDPNAAEWAGTVLDLADWLGQPTEPIFAEMVDDVPGVRHRAGRYTRKRTGFRVYARRVELITLTQELRARSDGKFAPFGDWTASSSTLHVNGEVNIRQGDVPADDSQPSDSVHDGTGETEPVRDALVALRYLPKVVRDGFFSTIPEPRFALAQVIRYSNQSGGGRFEAVALLVGHSSATALRATRHIGLSTWTVEQRNIPTSGTGDGAQ